MWDRTPNSLSIKMKNKLEPHYKKEVVFDLYLFDFWDNDKLHIKYNGDIVYAVEANSNDFD